MAPSGNGPGATLKALPNYTAKIKLNLSRSIPIQIDQGKNVATMSAGVMPPASPLIVALQTANTDLEAKHAAAIEARHALNEAFSAMRDSEASQRTAFNNLGGLVQTDADGNATYIMSCGFGVRSNGTPAPPVEDPPYALRTRHAEGPIGFDYSGGILPRTPDTDGL